jgi:uncharacterized protein YmfQ (DUF2313 family)
MGAHADLLKALLPPVAYDTTGHALSAELEAEGKQLDDYQAAVIALQQEMDPRTTTVLLPEWERVYGLPDEGLTLASTIEERQVVLTAKVGATGGLSKPYFKALLEAAGYTVLIDQPRGFFAGVNRAADRIYGEGKCIWYWRIRLRKNGALISSVDRARVAACLKSVKPAFSFFDIED